MIKLQNTRTDIRHFVHMSIWNIFIDSVLSSVWNNVWNNVRDSLKSISEIDYYD